MTRLLDKSEKTRLGSKSGASEVKQHKWFAKINWGLLRNTRPPVSAFSRLARPDSDTVIDRADVFEWARRCELPTPEGIEFAALGGSDIGGRVWQGRTWTERGGGGGPIWGIFERDTALRWGQLIGDRMDALLIYSLWDNSIYVDKIMGGGLTNKDRDPDMEWMFSGEFLRRQK